MQWQRISFRNPIGQFVVATTDWLVLPLRRFIPGLGGLDLASLLPAWVVQVLVVFIALALRGAIEGADPVGLLGEAKQGFAVGGFQAHGDLLGQLKLDLVESGVCSLPGLARAS
jgi:hypothetical protein